MGLWYNPVLRNCGIGFALLKEILGCLPVILPFLAVALLLACEGQPGLTPTVAPPAIAPTAAILPTATPLPPTPTPSPSPARYLEWFNAPRYTHQAAVAWYIRCSVAFAGLSGFTKGDNLGYGIRLFRF